MKKFSLYILLILAPLVSNAQEGSYFAGYELFEMSMNDFKNFAGEIGYRLDDDSQLRLTIMEVELSERHLSSSAESAAVKGGNVKGYFQGYELHYDNFFTDHWYYSYALGYYHDTYEHVILLDQKTDNNALTLGGGIGYFYRDLFGVDGLYVNFDVPLRLYTNPIEKQKLGDSTVQDHVLVNNIWLFVGYQF